MVKSAYLWNLNNPHVIQALATDATDQPLDIAILPRTSRCNQNLLDVDAFNSCPERFAVDSVAISNQIPRNSVFWKCFNVLLRCPNSHWMLGDIEVEDAATIVRHTLNLRRTGPAESDRSTPADHPWRVAEITIGKRHELPLESLRRGEVVGVTLLMPKLSP